MVANSTLPTASLVNDIPILGPIGVGVGTLGTTWSQILPADTARRGVVFYNGGANTLLVAPATLGVQAVAGALVIYPGNEAGIFASDQIANLNTAWMGWVDTGSNQPVSILNFTGTNASVPAPQPLTYLNFGVAISSPVSTGTTVGTGSVAVIGANPVRRAIMFHNPGSVNIAVTPANLSATFSAGGIVLVPGQTKKIAAEGLIRVNCGWNGIAASGASNPFTVMEFL